MWVSYMLNWIWGIMIIAGVLYGIVSGNSAQVGQGMMEGATEAVSLAMTMAAVLGFWCGLMEIAERAGILRMITRLLQPFIHFLFPGIPKEHEVMNYIGTNFAANMFGVSGAATPSGLKAMELLKEYDVERKKKRGETYMAQACDEMCTFLVINVSSLQLIPINLIAYRGQYGSVFPAAVTGPALLATLFSTCAAVIYCKIKCKNK